MSISLNNHETRIAALEAKGSGSWTIGSGNNHWARESSTGLLIQWSKGYTTTWGTVTMTKSYSSTTSFTVQATQGTTHENWNPTSSDSTMFIKSANSFNLWSGERNRNYWIAIGYLISDRILNYIYTRVNRFLPLFKVVMSYGIAC